MKHSQLTAMLVVALFGAARLAIVNEPLAAAERLLLEGHYEEAAEAFEKLRAEAPVHSSLGLSRSHSERGRLDEAAAVLDAALKQSQSPDLYAERGALELRRGRLAEAKRAVEQALKLEQNHLHARWLQSELWRVTGQVDDASRAYQWFADQWDRRGRQIDDPRELRWLGLGLAQHARWNRDARRFPQLVGELYPRAIELQEKFWPAHFEMGQLLAEKFNEAEAVEAFGEALRINSRAAEAHAALARVAIGQFDLNQARQHIGRALATDANCLPALVSKADVEFAALRPAEAAEILQSARKLNPISEETLGRLAAAHELLPDDSGESADELLAAVRRNNPHPGEYHAAWAEALELSRRYRAAGEQLKKSIELLPQLVGTRGALGLIEMRLGREKTAHRLLEESFAIDPYNIRVKNQLEVLDLLSDYTTVTTEHFIIRFDGRESERLGRCLAEHAEATYADLAKAFGYELPRRAVLEVFTAGKGHSGDEWFAVRMIGLPNIHTIAACGGNVVAMAAPAGRSRVNWADIMRHELVHLFNLQQTDYAVPHWFTEGCAVWLEGRPRQDRWNRLLVKRADKGELFDLDSLDEAFIRPKSGDDWQLAYCLAELYAECLIDQHGDDALAQMLAEYAKNRSTAEALKLAFGATIEDYESAVQQKIQQTLGELRSRRAYAAEPEIEKLEAAHDKDRDDPQAAAKLAAARLRQGEVAEAGRLTGIALVSAPDHHLGRLVRAKLLVRIGDDRAALELLEPVVEAKKPLPEAVELAAAIHLRREEFQEAAVLYEQGAELEPGELNWTKASAALAVKRGDASAAKPLLVRIAEAEPNDLLIRKKLLQLASARDDTPQIVRWADEVLHINVDDLAAHRQLAAALRKLGQTDRAALHEKIAAAPE